MLQNITKTLLVSVLFLACVAVSLAQDQFHGFKIGRYEGNGHLSPNAGGKVVFEIKSINRATGDVTVRYEFTQAMPVSETFTGTIDDSGVLRVSGPFLAYDKMEIVGRVNGNTLTANTRATTSSRSENGSFTVTVAGNGDDNQPPLDGGVKEPNRPADENKNNKITTLPNGEAFKVGARVDTYYDQQRGRRRGTIIAIGNGGYKVTYGCPNFGDEWKESSLVKPVATISKDAPEIKFLMGKWSLTTVGVSDWAIAWGKSPGIQINPDGTLIWYQGDGKPPLKAAWTIDAKVPGSQDEDGITFNDAGGIVWKVDRWSVKGDNTDRMEVYQMCYQAISKTGKRVR